MPWKSGFPKFNSCWAVRCMAALWSQAIHTITRRIPVSIKFTNPNYPIGCKPSINHEIDPFPRKSSQFENIIDTTTIAPYHISMCEFRNQSREISLGAIIFPYGEMARFPIKSQVCAHSVSAYAASADFKFKLPSVPMHQSYSHRIAPDDVIVCSILSTSHATLARMEWRRWWWWSRTLGLAHLAWYLNLIQRIYAAACPLANATEYM